MELQGYCEIKPDATTGQSHLPLDQFVGKVVRVMEFTDQGDVLVINAEATGLATFDKCDVRRSFRCSEFGEMLTPPDMNFIEQSMYVFKCMHRKGGWDPILKHMLIGHSLHKGKFNDVFLFQKEQEENEQKRRDSQASC